MNRLDDRVAIVTGGSRGIGAATVQCFLKEGAQVCIWDITEPVENHFDPELSDKWSFDQVNTADHAQVQAAARKVFDRWGQIDILINNAGITRDATLLKMSPQQWQEVIDINLTGVFNCAQAVAPFMVEGGYGRIVSASSVVAHDGNYGQSNYVAAKSGLIGMTKVWARELGPKGITANVVAPGFIATTMLETIPPKVLDRVIERTPLRRVGRPEDIAAAYLFLASDEAAFINGTVLRVDGGLSL